MIYRSVRLESRMGDQLEELKRSANERESRLRDDFQRRISELEKVPLCVCVSQTQEIFVRVLVFVERSRVSQPEARILHAVSGRDGRGARALAA